MEFEHNFCNRELSKRLKELGVEQNSTAIHFKDGGKWETQWFEKPVTYFFNDRGIEWYSAFTIAELGEMLPDNIVSSKFGNGWVCYDRNDNFGRGQREKGKKGDTEADARATMLIWLLENKKIEV